VMFMPKGIVGIPSQISALAARLARKKNTPAKADMDVAGITRPDATDP
jgi:hypothetical protein